MKNTLKIGLIGAAALAGMCSSCQNEDLTNGSADALNTFTKQWIKDFGIVDPAQDWNMAMKVTADIDITAFGADAEVFIYSDAPGKGGILVGYAVASTSLDMDVKKSCTLKM